MSLFPRVGRIPLRAVPRAGRLPWISRSYHSHDHPSPPPSSQFSSAESAILSAAYRHVPELGFTEKALTAGASDAGYPGISVAGLEDGPFALVRWHLVSSREALQRKAEEEEVPADAKNDTLESKIEQLMWSRLQLNIPIVHKWQEALALMAYPAYATHSLRELATLADDICFLSGDVSTDPTWYARRAGVSTAYAASELFMTTDASAGFAQTRDFLHRRRREAVSLGQTVSDITEWASFTMAAGVNVLRSKGVRI